MNDEQLADWWLLYQHSPFGEEREDYRAWFASFRAWSADGHIPTYPYVESPITPDEIQAALEASRETD